MSLWFLGFQIQSPAGPLVAQLGGSVLLPCSVETPLPLEELEVEWRRTDSESLVHLFQEGEVRPESQDYTYRGRAHFFTVDMSKGNYSLLLNNVSREDAGIYSCKVYTENEAHKITVDLEGVGEYWCFFFFLMILNLPIQFLPIMELEIANRK